ncbi:MAG: HupE/UreJ family protein [Ahrensia sp.]|nr:HupE/UreJ family protein [Ahrensia sp.]
MYADETLHTRVKPFAQLRLIAVIALFAIGALIAQTHNALAHEVTPAIVSLSFGEEDSYQIKLEGNFEAMLAKIGADHEDTDDAPGASLYNALRQLPPGQLEPRFRDFASDFLPHLGLSFDGQAATPSIDAVDIPPVGDVELARQSVVTLSGRVPAGAQTLQWAFPEAVGASVLRIERPGEDVQAQFFAAGARSDSIAIGSADQRSWIAKAVDYGWIGFTHILPKGADHILFVLGLFLLSTRWPPLLWQVTAFTVAHSITLALGLYGVVSISPAIVEPLIALSIVYVGIENVFTQRLHAWRTAIVFAFGLLHGLGFAGILSEIGLPRGDFVLGLVAFNIGVELGQLAVIAIAFVLVWTFINKPWYRGRIVIPASLAIAAIGAFWFAERVGLLG